MASILNFSGKGTFKNWIALGARRVKNFVTIHGFALKSLQILEQRIEDDEILKKLLVFLIKNKNYIFPHPLY